jgi:hypothetical protein
MPTYLQPSSLQSYDPEIMISDCINIGILRDESGSLKQYSGMESVRRVWIALLYPYHEKHLTPNIEVWLDFHPLDQQHLRSVGILLA